MFGLWRILILWILVPTKSPDTDVHVSELNDIKIETESNVELVTNPKISNPIFLPEPNTKALISHIHKKNMRTSTPAVSLDDLLFKYREKIRWRMMLSKNSYKYIIEIHGKMHEFLAENYVFLASPAPILSPFFAEATYFNISPNLPWILLSPLWKC